MSGASELPGQETRARLFVGLPVCGEFRDRFAELRRGVDYVAIVDRLRWIPPSNFHLTLAFLGQTENAQRAEIVAAMVLAAGACTTFALRFGGICVFPDPRRPRVLAAMPQASRALSDLVQALTKALRERGFPLDGGPFRGHLSLARIRGRRQLAFPPAQIETIELPVTQLVLYESVSRSGFVHYRPLFRVELVR